ncbi:peptidase M41 [Pseudomonas sp. PCH199]|uniref:peptidase M41 n=1 Tax=unclassified Pseudomonas TaxID=196821 RepID=UPI000BD81383|nr:MULTISPECIES: peptidase M41 [unclassified Pseudomonas]MCW8274831.1 peptidase M41 [Pseudomonas sp. PCH199]PAM85493.1 peptidase M41 [Pseudomonas sp. ERMR1:02]
MDVKKMPAAVREHALQIAHHEMGHYVVARTLGFETGGVTLTVTMDLRHKGGASISLVRPISSMEAMKEYLEARIMVLFAGTMAQTLPSAHTHEKHVDKSQAAAILNGVLGAERDDAKIRELRHLLRNITYPDTDPAACDSITAELKAINDRLWLRAQDIVEALAETITELAETLVSRLVLVEQWGRPADTYEVVLTREVLERMKPL